MHRTVPLAIGIVALALTVVLVPLASAQGPNWCPNPYYGDSFLSSYYSSYSYNPYCYNPSYYGSSSYGSNYYQPYSQYYPQAYYNNFCYPVQQVPVKPAKVKTVYVQQPCPTPAPVYVYVQQPVVQQPEIVYVQPTPCPAPQTVYVQPAAPCVVPETAIQVATCAAIPHDITWGSFGTYDNWARAFEQQHCRPPTAQDECDFWWSQQYAARTGASPFKTTWCWDCNNK